MIRISQNTALSISVGAAFVAGMFILFSDSSDGDYRIIQSERPEDMMLPDEVGYMKALLRMSSTDPEALDCEVADTMATHWSSTSDFRSAYQDAAMEDVPEAPDSPEGQPQNGHEHVNMSRLPLR